MSETKLDRGTLRALIAEAHVSERTWRECCQVDLADVFKGRADWLQANLDKQKEPPTAEWMDVRIEGEYKPPTPTPVPSLPPDLAKALKGWRDNYEPRVPCPHAEKELAAAIDRAREKGGSYE